MIGWLSEGADVKAASASSEYPAPPVGLVVIGRNEGERLRDCLVSLAGQGVYLIYVDSGSSDGSQALAAGLGAEVVELDLSRPFSMARARNTGLARVRELVPPVEFVHFFDGDCQIEPGWVEQAWRYLAPRAGVAAVCGRRRERYPDRSLYNAIADLEWDGPTGPVAAVGGDALYRIGAFAAAGGFNEALIAGEEPELCWRLRRAGHEIHRLGQDMTLHDAQLLRFRHWWRRMVRGGYGSLDVLRRCQALTGQDGDLPFANMVTSARRWTLGWASATLGLALLLALTWGWSGALLALGAGLGLWLGQALRIARPARRLLPGWRALAYGGLTLVGKWAQILGQWRYLCDQRQGRAAELIEYKGAGARPVSDWRADRARYPESALVREQSLWAIAVYRFGRWNDRRPAGLSRWLLDRLYWLLFRLMETLTGVSFTKATEIGPGLRIFHFGNIFIHSGVRMGANCTLRQGVTIGNREEGGPVPVVEDEVDFGAYAQVLGGIRIGRGARIGAMTLVLRDVPPGYTAVGIPARLIPPREEGDLSSPTPVPTATPIPTPTAEGGL
jgi:serine acetyltransferase/glycosyltransferase involved in cell wall biosynthesis